MMQDDLFPEELGAGETAIDYTNQFVDAAIAKLDAVFGEGYARENPAALAGYVTACGSNLSAFMTASMGMMEPMMDGDPQNDDLGAALQALMDQAKGGR